MKFIYSIFTLALSIMVLANSCQSKPEKPKGNFVNPNGSSELAVMMNEMFENSEEVGELIKNGQLPEAIEVFEKIHTADATEPEKVSTDLFKVMADNYLQSVKQLKNSNKKNMKDHYNLMVDNCMSCHKAICPGPTVRIKKLYLASN